MAKNKELLYEQVLNQLQNQIVSGAYKKGDKLPSENELIESMGVSRVTIRKAQAILAERGMIQTRRGQKSEVLFSYENVDTHESFAKAVSEYRKAFNASTQIRLMLEPEIARQAAAVVTQAHIEKLRATVDGTDVKNFHLALAECLDNPQLMIVLEHIIQIEESQEPSGFISPECQEDAYKNFQLQHEKILDAIEAHNGEFAYFYMKEHLTYVAQVYQCLLGSQPA